MFGSVSSHCCLPQLVHQRHQLISELSWRTPLIHSFSTDCLGPSRALLPEPYSLTGWPYPLRSGHAFCSFHTSSYSWGPFCLQEVLPGLLSLHKGPTTTHEEFPCFLYPLSPGCTSHSHCSHFYATGCLELP